MKTYQFRDLSTEDLQSSLKENHEALENFRFQHAVGQLENFKAISNTKKDIAKILTVLNERKHGINQDLKKGKK